MKQRVIEAYTSLHSCDGCAWQCGVNRMTGQLGQCRTGELARVSHYGPHLGEENPLRGWRGSGTIFFTRCNLRCVFCQNYDISQSDRGKELTPADLAGIMLKLQEHGCHNINLVSPSHVVPQILAAALLAAQTGLSIPLVYNSGGFDSINSLRRLEGVVDIYMPDMKYADEETAWRLSGIHNYPEVNRIVVREMHRQVGDLQLDPRGLARRGLLVRHLVLPGGLAGTEQILQFLAAEISPNTYLNLMDQYHPDYLAVNHPEINRHISPVEYTRLADIARGLGLRLDG